MKFLWLVRNGCFEKSLSQTIPAGATIALVVGCPRYAAMTSGGLSQILDDMGPARKSNQKSDKRVVYCTVCGVGKREVTEGEVGSCHDAR